MKVQRVELEPHRMVGVHEVVALAELPSFFGRAPATVTAAHGLTPTAVMWEQYLVGRGVEPDPTKWQTRIVYPIGQ